MKDISGTWYHKIYKGHKMKIVKDKRLFAIQHTYPNGHSGILSMESKPRWYLIDLLLKCGWKLRKK